MRSFHFTKLLFEGTDPKVHALQAMVLGTRLGDVHRGRIRPGVCTGLRIYYWNDKECCDEGHRDPHQERRENGRGQCS